MMSKGYIPVQLRALVRVLREGLDPRACQAMVLTQLLAAASNQVQGEVWVGDLNDLHQLAGLPANETWEILAKAKEMNLLSTRKQHDATAITINPCAMSFAKETHNAYGMQCAVYNELKRGKAPVRTLKTRRFLNTGKVKAVITETEKEGELEHLQLAIHAKALSEKNELRFEDEIQ